MNQSQKAFAGIGIIVFIVCLSLSLYYFDRAGVLEEEGTFYQSPTRFTEGGYYWRSGYRSQYLQAQSNGNIFLALAFAIPIPLWILSSFLGDSESTKKEEISKLEEETVNYCTECGAELEPDAEFCIKCGAEVGRERQ